ncbi:hypothetical protein OAM56_00330 [Alphaproteobacteria bacterium]|nr:hypothetical protein [Alphaproteobacteria bacterium]
MAEEIIDLRDRIEKMRIQIETEATEQILSGKPLEIHQKTSSSNISLSLQDKIDETNYNKNLATDSLTLKKDQKQLKETSNIKETFPSVSLSVKNPVSSKVLIMMIIFQILSNVGILYFLYLGME